MKYSQNIPVNKEYFVDVKDCFSAIKYILLLLFLINIFFSLEANGQLAGEKRLMLWFGIRLSSVAAILIRGLTPSINNLTEWKNCMNESEGEW